MLSCGERRTAPSLLDFYRNIQKVRHTFIQKQFRTSPQIQGRDRRLRALSSDGVDILHDFWLARGVNDHAHRSELIDYGCDQLESTLAAQEEYRDSPIDSQLPGAHALWYLQSSAEQGALVRAITAKLVTLHALLGNRRDIDVASMLIRCPKLLSTTPSSIVLRMVKMKGTEGAAGLDIGKILESQPHLLLCQQPGLESPDAWRFGLTSSADDEWLRQMTALQEFKASKGHSHAGFCSEDDPDLAKFARMQRSSFRKGTLPLSRREELEAIGFEFDADTAEWGFMYGRLQEAQQNLSGHDAILDGGFDFLLNNWCSVQRISNRSGMLSEKRRQLLNAVNFDWTGADALS